MLGLEEDGVHGRQRIAARGASLEGLSAADLAAVGCDRRVVGHVLRLEGGDTDAPVGEGAAEAGNDGRLADVAAGAHEHERPSHPFRLHYQ